MDVCVKITAKGRVQGVGFRWFIMREAEKFGLYGYVKNLYNEDVEIVAEGTQSRVEELIKQVRKGPAFSRVDDVVVEWKEYANQYSSFKVEF